MACKPSCLRVQGRRVMASQLADLPGLSVLYNGRETLGFLLKRGREGVEAFTSDERTLGLFPIVAAAADAIREGGSNADSMTI